MFTWVSELIFGAAEDANASASSGNHKNARVVPDMSSPNSDVTDPAEVTLSDTTDSSLVDYSGARSIVIAAVLEDLMDRDIDAIIEDYEDETGKTEEIPVHILEDLILKRVDKEIPIEELIQEQPFLEFDLAGMDTKELAETYREQVNDLFSLGADVVGRQIDYADVESIIGHSPAPPFKIQKDDEFNISGKEFNLGEWGVFNSSLRATLLLLAYQHSNLETAGAILRLIRHLFRINADKECTYDDLDKFVEFCRLQIYDNDESLNGDEDDDRDEDDDLEFTDDDDDNDKKEDDLDDLMNDLNLSDFSDGEADSDDDDLDVDELFDNLDREQVPAVSVDVRSSTEITLDT
jgi:hypothetical protein